LILIVVILAGVVGYFVLNKKSETLPIQQPSTQDQEQTTVQNAGFAAELTGARTAMISAPGVFFCLSEYEYSPDRIQPSYLALADNQGVRENGITFSIPRGKPSGTYNLTPNPNPFAIGTVFEVRGEFGSTVDYFNKETEGTITIISMPQGGLLDERPLIKGSFEFETSNSQGERVKVKGQFDFPAPQDGSKYCQ
jgi:hypothetical protein